MKSLEVGDKAPEFQLFNQNGKLVDISKFIGVKPLIIYFYPKNFTPGCTAQACSFRDEFADFSNSGAAVFGISTDSVNSHNRFSKKHNLPFDTLADQKGKIRKLYGVKADLFGLLPGRETFIIDSEGILKMRFHSMAAGKHIPKALEVLKSMK